MNSKVFIISGKSQAGKDTTANFIKKYVESNGLKCINLQFSRYIKMYAKLITDWDGVDENKPRTLLQDLGSIIREEISPTFFIDRMIDDIKILSKYADVFTISDTRLPNELDLVAKAFDNSYKIRIIRPGYDNKLNSSQQQHITETALDDYTDYDYIVNNDGTIDDLEVKAINMVNELKK